MFESLNWAILKTFPSVFFTPLPQLHLASIGLHYLCSTLFTIVGWRTFFLSFFVVGPSVCEITLAVQLCERVRARESAALFMGFIPAVLVSLSCFE